VRVSQARPLQREFNRLCSQIGENIDVVGNAIIMAPRQSKLQYKRLDNGAGNIIEYDGPVGKPTREAGVPLSGQAFQYLYAKKDAIDEIFAFHAAMRGVAPTGVDSGKALQSLQGADVQHMGPLVDGFELADQNIMYQALTVAFANYPEKKMLNVVGDDFSWSLLTLDKAQLRGKFNVIVKPKSSMPIDKDAESAQTFQLWQSGLLGDPQDPNLRVWVMSQMNLGNADSLLQKHAKQENFAKREFMGAAKNLESIQLPPNASKEQLAQELEKYLYIPHINPFDDHGIHIACHNEWMMDNYWDYIATGNPLQIEFVQRCMLHIAEHQGLLAQAQEMQFQKQLNSEMLLKGNTMEQLMIKRMNFEPKDKPESKGKTK
jgi:hypothetical protein